MQFGKCIVGIFGASAISTATYFLNQDENQSPLVYAVDIDASQNKERQIKNLGSVPMIVDSVLSVDKGALEYLEENRKLKLRIQGTLWYRDFVNGKLDVVTMRKYLQDAQSIEDMLQSNPSILESIHYEEWWKKYIQGSTNPSIMLHGNMKSYLKNMRIMKEDGDFYAKASQNKNWNKGVHYGDNYIVVSQYEFLISLKNWIKYLDMNPEIEIKLNNNGFRREQLFTDDWSVSEGIYGALNGIRNDE